MRFNNFSYNLALKTSLIYAINCYNPIVVSGGLVSRNGFQYHPFFSNPHEIISKLFSIENNSLGSYFDLRFIKKIIQIFSTDNDQF